MGWGRFVRSQPIFNMGWAEKLNKNSDWYKNRHLQEIKEVVSIPLPENTDNFIMKFIKRLHKWASK